MASMVPTVQSNNSNLVDMMDATTLKEVPIAVLQVHGSMGKSLDAEEKAIIKKHLDILQMVEEGGVCWTTKTEKHSEAVFEVAKKFGNILWEKSERGKAARAEAQAILNFYFQGASNSFQLFNYNNNWVFLNDVLGLHDTATFQMDTNHQSRNSRQIFDRNFDLLEFANWVATQLPRGPNMDRMNVDTSDGTPYRMKVIIIACMGSSSGGDMSKTYGGRRKTKRKRRRKKTRKKRKRRKSRKRKRRKRRK